MLPGFGCAPSVLAMVLWAGLAHAQPVRELTLDNGLRVVVVEHHGSPGVVAWNLRVGVGSGDEVAPGTTGLAHFVEHLMFLDGGSDRGRDDALLALGVDENAWTWLDETAYHAMLPSSSFDAWAAMEGARFAEARWTADDVTREAGAVQGEYRNAVADPGFALEEALRATAFRGHPYGHDTLGIQADVAALPGAFEASRRFHAQHYRPDNAVLVVVGDLDDAHVETVLRGAFGGWRPAAARPPAVAPEPPQRGARRATVAWPGATAPRLTLAWRIPRHGAADRTSAALELAAQWLLAPTGPLQERLVRGGLAKEVHGEREATADGGLLRIDVVGRDEVDLADVEAVIRASVAALDELTDEALAPVQSHVRYARLVALDDPSDVADVLGEAAIRGAEQGPPGTFDATLAAVTATDVRAAAARWLVDRGLTAITLAPEAPAP